MSAMRALWLLFIGCPSATAAVPLDEGLCRNGMFAVQNSSVGLGIVAGGGRAYFVDDLQGCPNADAKCRLTSYLITGDRVVTGSTHGKYVCIYHPGKHGGTAGWVDAARIRPLTVQHNPPLSAWVGRWSDHGNPIVRFYSRNGRLRAHGEAAWPSFNPPREISPGGPHVGEISEVVQTAGNRAYAAECEITFILLGDLLVAADPKMQCGGVNVSFSGVYSRLKQ